MVKLIACSLHSECKKEARKKNKTKGYKSLLRTRFSVVFRRECGEINEKEKGNKSRSFDGRAGEFSEKYMLRNIAKLDIRSSILYFILMTGKTHYYTIEFFCFKIFFFKHLYSGRVKITIKKKTKIPSKSVFKLRATRTITFIIIIMLF